MHLHVRVKSLTARFHADTDSGNMEYCILFLTCSIFADAQHGRGRGTRRHGIPALSGHNSI